jgi:hypothetical protein
MEHIGVVMPSSDPSNTSEPAQLSIDKVREELTNELRQAEATEARLRAELEQARDQRIFLAGQLTMLGRIVLYQ